MRLEDAMSRLELLLGRFAKDWLMVLQLLFLAQAAQVRPTCGLSVTGQRLTRDVSRHDGAVALGAGPCGRGGELPH